MSRIGWKGLVMGAVLACLVFAAVAIASTRSSPTRVILDKLTTSGEGPTFEGEFVGHLKSPSKKCLRGRTVKLFLRNGNTGESKLADTDKTGKKGRWRLDANLYTIDRAKVKVTRKRVGSGDHRRICKPDSLKQFFA